MPETTDTPLTTELTCEPAACQELVVVDTANFGTRPICARCGRYWGGRRVLCPACEARLLQRYPQGWDYYPGDRCRHGTYVGGCGPDLMCFWCEQGAD